MSRWQKLLRHDALIHSYKEAVRNAMAYACPRLGGTAARVEQSPAGMEPLEPRLLLSGTVEGTVFDDTNGNHTYQSGTDGDLADWHVFIDEDGDGVWNADVGDTEPGDTTNASGFYQFDVDHDVTHTILAVDPIADDGWLVTAPSSGEHAVQVGENLTSSNNDFAVATASISGAATASESMFDNYELMLASTGLVNPTWDIFWGDGTSSLDVTGSSINHRYADGPDTFTITATATDGVDSSLVFDAPSISVDMYDADPWVFYGGIIQPPGGWVFEGDEIQYKLSVFEFGDDPLVQIDVNWLDGTTQLFTAAELTVEPDGFTYLFPHTYLDSGLFEPVFTVTTEGSNPVTAIGSINIANATPFIDVPDNGTAVVGELVELNLHATDPGASDTIQKWRILWGDEAPGADPQEIDVVASNPSDLTVAHQYLTAGNYDVVIQAMDNEGAWTGLELPAGDLDEDGFVGLGDLNIVLLNWNQNVPPADPRADPNGDGFVGLSDLNVILLNWNKSSFSFEMAVSDETSPAPLTFTVSTTADELDLASDALSYIPGDLSLREALALAANHPGQDIIEFDPTLFATAQTIVLGGTALLIDSDVTIEGTGADLLAISASTTSGQESRVFNIASGVAATIDGLTVTNGGVYNAGQLALDAVTIRNSIASAASAIYMRSNQGATLDLLNSTIAENAGSGIYMQYGGHGAVNITNSTISGNVGAGFKYSGGTTAGITFVNVTVTDNDGGGISSEFSSGPLLHNTIVVDNDQHGAYDLYRLFNTDSSFNLIGSQSQGGLTGGVNNNQVGVTATDLKLAPLGYYGGHTPTHALLAGSIAIDAGDNDAATDAGLTTDQRGLGRDVDVDSDGPVNGTVDIGAVEAVHVSLTVTPTSPTQLDLIWIENTNNATGFLIERIDPLVDTDWVPQHTAGPTETSYFDTNISEGHWYLYRVTAMNSNDTIGFSTEVVGVTPVIAPTGLGITTLAPDQAVLTWTNHSSAATGYLVEWSLYDTFSEILGAESVDADAQSATVNGAFVAGVPYHFRVRAVGINNDYSSQDDYSITPANFLDAPTNLKAETISGTQIDLTWGYIVTGNETDLVIERREILTGDDWAIRAMVNPIDIDYSDTGLFDGQWFEYRLRAINITTSEASDHSNLAGGVSLEPPIELSGQAQSPVEVHLSWDNMSNNETSFLIEWSTDPNFNTVIGNQSEQANTFAADVSGTFDPGITYHFRVRAVGLGGTLSQPDVIELPMPVYPNKPGELAANYVSTSQIDLAWIDNAGNENGYSIERLTVGAGNGWVVLPGLDTGANSYNDTGLVEGQLYRYRVRAQYNEWYSEYSDEASEVPMQTPTGLSVTYVSSDAAGLNWSSTASGESGFIAEWSLTSDFNEVLGTLYTDADTTNAILNATYNTGTNYHFRVRTVYGTGVFSEPDTQMFTPVSSSSAPIILSATLVSSNQIDVTWGDNVSERSYIVERLDLSVSPDWAIISQPIVAGPYIYHDTTAVEGKAYSYRIRAMAGANGTPASNVIDVAAALVRPSLVQVAPITSASDDAHVIWTDSSLIETGYRLEWSLTSDFQDLIGYENYDQGDTSAVISGPFNPLTQYHFRVRAIDTVTGTESPNTSTSVTTEEGYLLAPSGLSIVSTSDHQIDLSWDEVFSETGYTIQRASPDLEDWVLVGTTNVDDTDFSSPGLLEGKSYRFRVFATKPGITSDYSEVVQGTTRLSAPDPVVVNYPGPDQALVAWSDKSVEADSYLIEWSTSAGNDFDTNIQGSTTVGGDEVSATVYGSFSRVTNYTFHVTAVAPHATSEPGVRSKATADAYPNPPQNVTATAVSEDQVVLTWNWHQFANGGYRIDRRNVTEAGAWSQVGAMSQVAEPANGDPVTYSDTIGLLEFRTYEYRVRAVRNGYLGNPGDVVSVATFTNQPTNLIVTSIAPNEAQLTWTDTSMAELAHLVEWSLTSDFASVLGGQSVPANEDSITLYGNFEANKTYHFRVRSTADFIQYSTAWQTTRTTANDPLAPTQLEVTPTRDGEVRLTWLNNATGHDNYNIERIDYSVSDNWVLLDTVLPGDTEYLDQTTSESSSYRYRVRAKTGGVLSIASNEVQVAVPPLAPDSFAIFSITAEAAKLTWADRSLTATHYQVEWSASPDYPVSDTAVVTVNPGDNEVIISQLSYYWLPLQFEPDTTYYFRLRAYDSATNEYSFISEESVTTTSYPAAPTGLTVTSVANDRVELEWIDNADNETAYVIERSDWGSDNWAPIANPASPGTGTGPMTHIDTTVTEGLSYQYRVRAERTNFIDSANSAVVIAHVLPDDPTGLTVDSINATQAVVSWTDVSLNNGSYLIQWSHSPNFDDDPYGQIHGWGAYAGATDTTATINWNFTPGSTYHFRIIAVSYTGNSGPDVTTTNTNNFPLAPTDLAVAVSSTSVVDLTWIDNASDEASFILERIDHAAGPDWIVIEPELGANVTIYSDTTVLEGHQYTYRLRASNSDGDSASTQEVYAYLPPLAPTDLQVLSMDSNSADLIWVNHTTHGDGYLIEWSESPDFIETDIYAYFRSAQAPAGSQSITITELYGQEIQFDTDVTYYFRIRAYGASGFYGYTYSDPAEDTFTTTGYPETPTGLTATAVSPNQIDLAWVDGTSESGYVIERRDRFAGVWTQIHGPTGQDVKTFSDTVVEGGGYDYRIYATNDSGDSPYSEVINGDTKPLNPSGLTVSSISATQAEVAWPDVSSHNAGYVVVWSLSPDFDDNPYTYGNVTYADADDTSATISWNFEPDTLYYFRVQAYSDTGVYSDGFETSFTSADFPLAPTDLLVTDDAPNQVELEWIHNADNNDAYLIERLEGWSGWFVDGADWIQLVDDLPSDATSYTDTSAVEGHIYSYRIRATNTTHGDSADAYTWYAAFVRPLAPTNLAVSGASFGEVQLSWTNHSLNNDGYTIEWSLDPEFSSIQGSKSDISADATAAVLNDQDLFYIPWNNTWDPSEPGTVYHFRVRAFSYDTNYSSAAFAAYTTSEFPSTPTGLEATSVTSDQIVLAWADNENEDFYVIERSSSNWWFDPWIEFGTVSSGTSSFTDTSVVEGQSYTYRIRAINNQGESQPNENLYVTTPPIAPTVFNVVSISPDQATLSWFDNSGAESQYVIDWSLTSDFENDPIEGSYSFDPSTTSGTVNGTFAPDTDYYFRLRAKLNSSVYSDGVVSSDTSPDFPAAPSNLIVVSNTPGSIDVTWTDNAHNEADFIVERKGASPDDVWVEIGSAAANAVPGGPVTYHDSAPPLTEGARYYYRVRATHDTLDDSAPSEVVSASTKLITPAALNISSVTSSLAILTWSNASTAETGLRVQWSRNSDFSTVDGSRTAPVDAQGITIDANFLRNRIYYFRVVAVGNNNNDSDPTVEDYTTASFPNTPTSLIATSGSHKQIKLTWTDASFNENYYSIEKYDEASGTWPQFDTTSSVSGSGTEVTYTDSSSSYTEGTTFRYRVRAVSNTLGASKASNEAIKSTRLNIPTNLRIVGITSTRAYLTWDDNSQLETGYQIIWNGAWPNHDMFGNQTVGPDASGAIAIRTGSVNFKSGGTYSFKIKALGSGNSSQYTSNESQTIPTNPSYPNKPSGNIIENVVTGSIPGITEEGDVSYGPPEINWTQVGAADGYIISRRHDGGDWEVIAEVGATPTRYTDTTATGRDTYQYAVASLKNDGTASATIATSVATFYEPDADYDEDGITNEDEVELGIDPLNPDTDGDLFPDAWELQYDGFDPAVADNPRADYDEDGLNNIEELIAETDPTEKDTDEDGTSDGKEKEQGSDGNDATDKGLPPAEDMKALFRLTVGDDSGSHSERWSLTVGDTTHQAPDFGKVGSGDYWFDAGESYRITVDHQFSNLPSPDYDWMATVELLSGNDIQYFIHDNNDPAILQSGTFHGNDDNLVAGKEAFLFLPIIDLDVDSDNNGGVERSAAEDRLELDPSLGKQIDVGAEEFTPIVLSMSDFIGAAGFAGEVALNITFTSSTSGLNLWTKPANEARTAADLIQFSDPISAEDLGFFAYNETIPLYAELLDPNLSDIISLKAIMHVEGEFWSGALTDTIHLDPVRDIDTLVADAYLEETTVSSEADDTLVIYYEPDYDPDHPDHVAQMPVSLQAFIQPDGFDMDASWALMKVGSSTVLSSGTISHEAVEQNIYLDVDEGDAIYRLIVGFDYSDDGILQEEEIKVDQAIYFRGFVWDEAWFTPPNMANYVLDLEAPPAGAVVGGDAETYIVDQFERFEDKYSGYDWYELFQMDDAVEELRGTTEDDSFSFEYVDEGENPVWDFAWNHGELPIDGITVGVAWHEIMHANNDFADNYDKPWFASADEGIAYTLNAIVDVWAAQLSKFDDNFQEVMQMSNVSERQQGLLILAAQWRNLWANATNFGAVLNTPVAWGDGEDDRRQSDKDDLENLEEELPIDISIKALAEHYNRLFQNSYADSDLQIRFLAYAQDPYTQIKRTPHQFDDSGSVIIDAGLEADVPKVME